MKYDASGTRQWTRQLGGTASDFAEDVAVDAGGNAYVAGYTNGGLPGSFGASGSDVFLVKYDAGGVKQWMRQFDSADSDHARAVAVDSGGNAYLTGFTGGNLDGHASAGQADLFLVKYDAGGIKQ